jgi:hypothetical protein
MWSIPVAYNDPAGIWHVQVKDLLSGVMRIAAMEVF